MNVELIKIALEHAYHQRMQHGDKYKGTILITMGHKIKVTEEGRVYFDGEEVDKEEFIKEVLPKN